MLNHNDSEVSVMRFANGYTVSLACEDGTTYLTAYNPDGMQCDLCKFNTANFDTMLCVTKFLRIYSE